MPNPTPHDDVVPIRRALLSVSDKRGLIELARALADRGVALLASGGTRTALVASGLKVTEVADYTGQPEILGGRVKTLHPRIHAGILARRNVPEDLQVLAGQAIDTIDLVVVNLYPFEATVANPAATFEDAVENIDIGGPSLIRAAAKNHEHVAVLTDPDQYAAFLDEVQARGGTTLQSRRRLAQAAFARTGTYDRAITDYFARVAKCRREPGGEVPAVARTSPFRFGRRSAMERTRTRRRPSTSIRTPGVPISRRPRCFMARNFPTTTSWTSTAP